MKIWRLNVIGGGSVNPNEEDCRNAADCIGFDGDSGMMIMRAVIGIGVSVADGCRLSFGCRFSLAERSLESMSVGIGG